MSDDQPRIRTNFVAHQAEESSVPLTKSGPIMAVLAVIAIGVVFGLWQLVSYVLNMDMITAMKHVDIKMQRPSQKDGYAHVDVTITNLNPAPVRNTTFKYTIKDGGGNAVADGNVSIPCAIPAGDSRTFTAVKLCPLNTQAGRMQAELVSLKYGPKPNIPPRVTDLFIEASALKDKEAIEFWTTIAKEAPQLPAAYVGLGRSLAANNDMDNAIKAYEKALRIDPDEENAHYNLGVLLYYKKDREGARREFEAAARLEPEDPAVISSLRTMDAQESVVKPADSETIVNP